MKFAKIGNKITSIDKVISERDKAVKLLAISYDFIDQKVKDGFGVHIAGQVGNIETKTNLLKKILSLLKEIDES